MNKRFLETAAIIIVVGLALTGFLVIITHAQTPPPSPFAQLIRISDREFVDPSAIRFLRFPVYLPPVPGCPDCQLRWGASLVVDGVPLQLDYTEEAEKKLKDLLRDVK